MADRARLCDYLIQHKKQTPRLCRNWALQGQRRCGWHDEWLEKRWTSDYQLGEEDRTQF